MMENKQDFNFEISHLVWQLFKLSGNIGYFMLLENIEDKNYLNLNEEMEK
ncbi:MAG: hypothetical protein RR400_04460 [Clostridia bacterium]